MSPSPSGEADGHQRASASGLRALCCDRIQDSPVAVRGRVVGLVGDDDVGASESLQAVRLSHRLDRGDHDLRAKVVRAAHHHPRIPTGSGYHADPLPQIGDELLEVDEDHDP
jgi:hypothetical protein